MKTIVAYVSDHGYGHATRMIALLRRLERAERIRLIIRNSSAYDLFKSATEWQVERSRNDVGVDFDQTTLRLRRSRTELKIRRFVDGLPSWTRREVRKLRANRPSAVLSDIPPGPFEAAEKAGVPSIAFSNFNWYWIYQRLFPTMDLSQIDECYSKCSLCLVLPFEADMSIFRERKKIPLVSRKANSAPSAVKAAFGLNKERSMVFVSSTSGSKALTSLIENLPPSSFEILTSTSLRTRAGKAIPKNYAETQNLVAASDLVIARTGYGIVSECVSSSVPMLLINRIGYPEDEVIADEVARLRIGKVITLSSTPPLDVSVDELVSLKENYRNIPKMLQQDGVSSAIDSIREFLYR